ncbi:MFS transporter [Collinsella tanakaei]|uniref:MFS transporter n=1 Tax=Collinsella tanakaei TaxID=626935 RepID=UPI00195C1803|nr:MFS transporter [Collinsella tanakaei]MBM6779873.1 MFS transporter [Collinsella tanakaei]
MARRDEKNNAGERGVGIATPRFAAVMASQALSLLGMEILQFVLPLHLLNLTGSGALYGGVVAAGFVPYTLLAPVGGVIADRTRKRGVMVAAAAALAAAMAVYLPLAGTAAVVPARVAVLMLAFAAQALEQPCVQSAIPHLVAPSEVGRAVALVNQVGMLTGIGGPVVGGLAFGFLGLAPIVVACVACFAASAVVEALTVRVPYEPPARTAGALATARADLAEALGFLRSSPLMWRTILGATLVNLFGSSFFNVCSPYIVTETLGLPNQLMGALQGALAVGGLAGGAVVAAVPGRFSIHSVPGLLACVAGGIALIAGALAAPLPALGIFGVLIALYLPTMAVCMCMSVVATSWLQTESPGTLVGKVMALALMLANFATPLGQLGYGVALDLVPAWAIALAAAGAIVVVAVWLARSARG